MNNQDKQQIYGLYLVRKDRGPILLVKSENFSDVKSEWTKLTDKWTESITESKPFKLEEPIVTAFDPGLVGEITIEPVDKGDNNPYKKAMMEKGLTNMLGSNQSQGGILDGGYK